MQRYSTDSKYENPRGISVMNRENVKEKQLNKATKMRLKAIQRGNLTPTRKLIEPSNFCC